MFRYGCFLFVLLQKFCINNVMNSWNYFQGLIDGIHAVQNKKEGEESDSELTRTDILKCIQSEKVRFRGVNLSGLDLSKLVIFSGFVQVDLISNAPHVIFGLPLVPTLLPSMLIKSLFLIIASIINEMGNANIIKNSNYYQRLIEYQNQFHD